MSTANRFEKREKNYRNYSPSPKNCQIYLVALTLYSAQVWNTNTTMTTWKRESFESIFVTWMLNKWIVFTIHKLMDCSTCNRIRIIVPWLLNDIENLRANGLQPIWQSSKYRKDNNGYRSVISTSKNEHNAGYSNQLEQCKMTRHTLISGYVSLYIGLHHAHHRHTGDSQPPPHLHHLRPIAPNYDVQSCTAAQLGT